MAKKKNELGDCFEWTGKFAMDYRRKKIQLAPTGEEFYGIPTVVHAVYKDCRVPLNKTTGHAFIMDDLYVYEKSSTKIDYKKSEIKDFFERLVLFKISENIYYMYIVDYKTHTFDELEELMANNGGKFCAYGITYDLM